MRILATTDNVQELFTKVTIPYSYTGADGNRATMQMPAWRCRTCSFTSLFGVKGLPFPHSCADVMLSKATPAVDETFTTDVKP
jgi:hypothetical protein